MQLLSSAAAIAVVGPVTVGRAAVKAEPLLAELLRGLPLLLF